MTNIIIGIIIGLLIGAGCRYFDVPAPAPPSLVGAFLVVAMTLGYIATDRLIKRRDATAVAATAHLCGGPSGEPVSARKR